MLNIIPQTEVRLLKTPLEKDSEHTMSFENINSQISYFYSRTFKSYNDFTYVREFNNAICIPSPYNEICTCNYLMYKNNGFTNKWFYAFITKMEYVNENMTRVYFEIDSLQTWYFEIRYNQTFVEREHAERDYIGDNTVPEALELGEYVYVKESEAYLNNTADYIVCMAISDVPSSEDCPVPAHTRVYTGLFGGLDYITFDNYEDLESCIEMYAKGAKSDAINYLFIIPKNMPSITNGVTMHWSYKSIDCDVRFISPYSGADLLDNMVFEMPNHLSGNYRPKNNKLYTYPYNYLLMSNHSGCEVVYRYEDFQNNSGNIDITFNILAVISPGMSIKAIPELYRNEMTNCIDGITCGKLPILSWNSDVYTNWLTQNGLNNGVNIALSVLSTVAGAGQGSVAGGVSGLQSLNNALGQRFGQKLVPDQARGNTNNGDVNFSAGMCGFRAYFMSIKPEFSRIIDEYFSKYGYATHRIKVPKLHTRRNWNYIKTLDCDFTGDIPQEDMQKIKDIFNRGITFWHNANNFLNYSANNDII